MIGRAKCENMTVDNGQMAVKKLIRHSAGAPKERYAMPPAQMMQNKNILQKFFRTLEISSLKGMSSISLAVAPHSILTLNKWLRMA